MRIKARSGRKSDTFLPSCFQINKNKMFAGINIHEFLKFLHQFKLRFLTENMEITLKVCNFLFALRSRSSNRGATIVLRNPQCYFLQTLWFYFRLHFCSNTKKLIISYVLILIRRAILCFRIIIFVVPQT